MTDAERIERIRHDHEHRPSKDWSADTRDAAWLLRQLDAANVDLAWARATPDERRARIADELRADPHVSTRTLGRRLRVGRELIAKVRAELAAAGEIPANGSRLGADGKHYTMKPKTANGAATAKMVPAPKEIPARHRTVEDVEAMVREARKVQTQTQERLT